MSTDHRCPSDISRPCSHATVDTPDRTPSSMTRVASSSSHRCTKYGRWSTMSDCSSRFVAYWSAIGRMCPPLHPAVRPQRLGERVGGQVELGEEYREGNLVLVRPAALFGEPPFPERPYGRCVASDDHARRPQTGVGGMAELP